jgi:peroxin-7
MFRTPAQHGYAVEFSPFIAHRLAAVCCQQYGIAGRGTIFFIDILPEGQSQLVRSFDWSDGLFDVAWSESNANVAVTAAGDGSVQAWDITKPEGPLAVWKEHAKEVYSVDWNLTRDADTFLTASWDTSIKLWNIQHPRSLSSYVGHENIVYSAIWCPLIPNCFSSASGDHTVRVWDTRKPNVAQLVITGHVTEVLSCDWCKYDQNILATASTDGGLRVWDLRRPRQCLHELKGHQYAARRVKFSPFETSVLLSCSYDFTVRTWNFAVQPTAPLETVEHHTEFVYGIDFNLHIPGQIADCSWDELIKVYSPRSLLHR